MPNIVIFVEVTGTHDLLVVCVQMAYIEIMAPINIPPPVTRPKHVQNPPRAPLTRHSDLRPDKASLPVILLKALTCAC